MITFNSGNSSIVIENNTAHVALTGSFQVLRYDKDAPIIFLIDEYHCEQEVIDERSKAIDENILIALNLVRYGGVTFAGVESHTGGQIWSDLSEKYTDEYDDGTKQDPYNNCPKFADGLRAEGVLVFGVECEKMADSLYGDCSASKENIKAHKLNKERSKHFIRTLSELRTRNKLNGNAILNAGSEHNSHIRKWVESGEIDKIVDMRYSYIRLRASTYPQRPSQ